MERSLEEKMCLVNLVLLGHPLRKVAREHGVCPHALESWLDRYRSGGKAGLQTRQPKTRNGKDKEEIVRLFLEKGVSLRTLCNRYDVSRGLIHLWLRQVRAYGYAILYRDGRQFRTKRLKMGRPKKKKPETELEKLQAENLRLRAENALLKKAKALVEEKRARARLNGLESSMD